MYFTDYGLNVKVCPGQRSTIIYGQSPVIVTVNNGRRFLFASIDILFRAGKLYIQIILFEFI